MRRGAEAILERNRNMPDRTEATPTPRLSIVVIVYRMARQADNTLYTLSPLHQREVDPSRYEVVVVENESDRNLDEERVRSLGSNIRYFRRRETGVSPAGAINEGLARCRGAYVGLMIDGARMVSPRVVRYALDAFRLTDDAVVAVPGYHIGEQQQHDHRAARYDERVEQELMASVDWRHDGYRLLEISRFSVANRNGFFQPFMESNCLFASRRNFARIGDADERFDLPGGGALILHMYRALGLLPRTRLVVLPGEGSFHQFHGGVTTSQRADRETLMVRQSEQLRAIWGGPFPSLRREAVMLGAVTGSAMPILEWSAARGRRRFERLGGDRLKQWPDDPEGPREPRTPAVSGEPREEADDDRPSREERSRADSSPRLSVLVVVEGMPRRARNTLSTLSPRYQREIAESEYEVVVVERESDRMLGREEVLAFGANFRYHRHGEAGGSPVEAIRHGLSHCRAPNVGLMSDAARMVTPRLLRYALDALVMDGEALVAVPAYRIGREAHHGGADAPLDERAGRDLLALADWRSNGYRLFEVASLDPVNPRGIFDPCLGRTVLFASRERLRPFEPGNEASPSESGAADLAPPLLSALHGSPGARTIVLPGEGTFLQVGNEGPVVSGSAGGPDPEARGLSPDETRTDDLRTRGAEPVLLGAVTGAALPFVQASARREREALRKAPWSSEGNPEQVVGPDGPTAR